MTVLARDTFNRTVTGGAGTADTGQVWQPTSNPRFGVTPGKLTAESTSSSRNPVATIPLGVQDIDFTGTWWIDALPVAGNCAPRFFARSIGSSDYHARLGVTPAGVTTLQLFRADAAGIGSSVAVPGITALAPGQKVKVRVQAIGINPTTIRAKAWPATDAEPTSWLVSGTDSTAALQVPGDSGLRSGLAGSVTNVPFYANFEDFTFTDGVEPITTGRIGTHVSLNPEQTALTIGIDRLGGTVVEAVLLSAGGTELQRKTVTIDSASGWGSARFTGLATGTSYQVKFDVDGVRQLDVSMTPKTLTATNSFVAVAGSCQFTGSNHPVWDRIKDESPAFLAHMGDLHYRDATTLEDWRSAVETSLVAPKMASLLETVPMQWTPDNHDRIIADKGGSGGSLNNGTTDPATNSEWRRLAGSTVYPASDTLGRAWQVGRVLFIQTDMWTVRDDPDFDSEPRTFLGATQKQWWKDTLAATNAAAIVWFCSWTARNNANGRWNGFPAESSELEAWLDARPDIKRRMFLIGGDSHSLNADDGSRLAANSFRFPGIPSLNMSGFNRSGDTGDSGPGTWSIANAPLRASGSNESDWGGYSRLTVVDDGSILTMKWDAVRVDLSGAADVMATYSKTFIPGVTAQGTLTLSGSAVADVAPREERTAVGTLALSGVAEGNAAGESPSRTAQGTLTLGGTAQAFAREARAAVGSLALSGSAVSAARFPHAYLGDVPVTIYVGDQLVWLG